MDIGKDIDGTLNLLNIRHCIYFMYTWTQDFIIYGHQDLIDIYINVNHFSKGGICHVIGHGMIFAAGICMMEHIDAADS